MSFTYIQLDITLIYISLVTITCYTLLFIYHFVKKESNKSLMILAGCMCLYSISNHSFNAYLVSLDESSIEYAHVATVNYLIWIIHSAITSIAIFLLHKFFKIIFHYTVRYILYSLMAISLLNLAMYVDIIVMGNREAYWLWPFFSYSENMVNLFMFLSVLTARKWSEVFKWFRLAHSH
jgi:hypothetical protein